VTKNSDERPETTDITVGPFRIEGVLGRGGMGIVYRAVRDDGTRAAVKVIRTEGHDGSDYLRRFQRESQIRIDHPNVVKILEADTDEHGAPYIAFELLQGETLRLRLRRGPLDPTEAVSIAIQACQGLGAAHTGGVIHRDLKPGNLFICDDGTVKVLDFGVARATDAESDLTMGRIVGTPAYLSPEQARGESDIDGRADIWALGVVLYEALSGKRPFRGESSLVTMMQIVMDQPVPLGRRVPGVSPLLSQIVHRCLSKESAERFHSAESLREALAVVGTASWAPPAQEVVPDDDETSVETKSVRGGSGVLTMAPDELRVVALVLANGVADAATLKQNIEQRGGIFVPLLGRQAIGLFGGVAWEGDEVVRATSAALLSRQTAAFVAVASGRGMRKGQSFSGAVVDAAERCCSFKLGGVAAPKATIQALGGGFAVRRVTPEVFEITAERVPFWPVGVQGEGKEPAIVGREAEVGQLSRVLDETVVNGTANAVILLGPAGIGKSRLRREMERLIEDRTEPVLFLSARADARKHETSLSVFESALRERARMGTFLRGWPDIGPEAPEMERHEGVLTLVRDAIDDDGRARECAGFLGELLGVPMPDSTMLNAARHDPQLMTDRLHLALRDYFEAACSTDPVALLVENLQWADDASIQLLQDLLDRLAFSPFLLFATARPELDDKWPGLLTDKGAVRVTLHGLRPADVGRLASSMVDGPLPPQLIKAVAQRTEGNPLFVAEIIRSLDADDLLYSAVDDLPLPLNVEAAVQSRLDQLPSREKELCKRAAVYGRPVSGAEMRALGVEEAEPLFASLARRELVTSRPPTRGRGQREFGFRTSLVADVAYRMLKDTMARELHGRAALFLSSQPEPDPEEVADHFQHGGQLMEAANWYVEATTAAERRGDSLAMLRCAEAALRLGAPSDKLYRLHMARADALRFRGERDKQELALEKATELASTPGDRARALMEWAVCMSRTGKLSEALLTAERAVSEARDSGAPSLLGLALGRQANLLTFSGQLEEAGRALAESTRLTERSSPHTRALVAEWRGLHANASGDLGTQVAAFEEAATLYADSGDVRRAAGAQNNVADAYNRVGAFADAERALRSTVTHCRRVGNKLIEGYALLNLGYAFAKLGREDEALRTLEEADLLASANSDVRLGLFVQVYRARVLLESGVRSDTKQGAQEASAVAQKAAANAERLSLPGAKIPALVIAARAMLVLGDAPAASALSNAAMELRDQMGGSEEDEAELFLTHASALDACGQPAEAAQVRSRGRSRLVEVAARIRDEDLRSRFLDDVETHRRLMGSD